MGFTAVVINGIGNEHGKQKGVVCMAAWKRKTCLFNPMGLNVGIDVLEFQRIILKKLVEVLLPVVFVP